MADAMAIIAVVVFTVVLIKYQVALTPRVNLDLVSYTRHRIHTRYELVLFSAVGV